MSSSTIPIIGLSGSSYTLHRSCRSQINSMSVPPLPKLAVRALSTDNTINIIIGVLTIVIGILSTLLGWAAWRLTGDRRRRLAHFSQYSGPSPSSVSLQNLHTQTPSERAGYEVTLRLGRSM
ncbi:hypothetical protein BDZ45DRAFT_276246 [Acephala macrosclerotiorum]|nr:hypothetical protein BDZ45DRAFT_276246 [Acephala macrosclerotiorum]